MDTKRLLTVARKIDVLEARIAALKNEARQIVAGLEVGPALRKRKMSAAARRRIAEAMRRRWAAIKKKA